MNAEWADRVAFAEVAEACNVSTDQIVGCQPATLVTYTTGFDPDDAVIVATLARHPVDGVLHLMTARRVSTVGEFEESIRKGVERTVEELLGDEDA